MEYLEQIENHTNIIMMYLVIRLHYFLNLLFKEPRDLMTGHRKDISECSHHIGSPRGLPVVGIPNRNLMLNTACKIAVREEIV